MSVRIGVPAKGRLSRNSLEWLHRRGLVFDEPEMGRRYTAETSGSASAELVFLSAGEIPGELYRGNILFGITGSDLVHERHPDWRDRIELLAELRFGHARLMVAVPSFWIDVDSVRDLDDVAARFRSRHGRGLRIATKYHTLVRTFLKGIDLTDYRLVDSQGATEGAVANDMSEAIADLVSTGTTLEANGLKPLADGVVFDTQAVFLRSKRALTSEYADDPDVKEISSWS